MRISLCEPMRVSRLLADALGASVSGAMPPLITGLATDSREVMAGDLFVALAGQRQHGAAFVGEAAAKGAVGVIATRGTTVPSGLSLWAVADPAAALLAAAHTRRQMSSARLVAISGSTGKTTAKDGIIAVLSQSGSVAGSQGNYNSSIGLPLSLLSFAESDFFVVELGINHVGEMRPMAEAAAADLAVLTNVGSAHIGHFADREDLLAEKLQLASGLRPDGTLLLPLELRTAVPKRLSCGVVSMGEGGDIYMDKIAMNENGLCGDLVTPDRVITNIRWPIPGRIGLAAVTAIGGACALLGCDDEVLRRGLLLAGERTPRMRMLRIGGRLVIDDSYNASPEAMAGALEMLRYRAAGQRETVAVLGDMLELGKMSGKLHFELGDEVRKNDISLLVTFGSEAAAIAAGAVAAGMPQNAVRCFDEKDYASLVKMLLRETSPTAAVLIKGSAGMKMHRVVQELGRQI
ncbi:MAG: UDP-N-acetylmuramoyl-tripeptide--D-alanyl-D-alanine ligase [Ruminococcaceae bacterium]|nr:UDP-N-acetylmuramoyl-tripeptide--D-alanyl-D-alanine ligase [Oscillospiraceae bacterium]